jgi:hypothetical protein
MGFALVKINITLLIVLLLNGAAIKSVHADECAVMFVPGAFATRSTASALFLKASDYLKAYMEAAESWGCATKMAELPTDGTIEEQGMVLKEQLVNFSNEHHARIHIIGHSQGALDAAYVIHDFRMEANVASLVSIGTPFHGTPIADWAMAQKNEKSFYYYFLKWIGSYDLAKLNFAPELQPDFMKQQAAHFARNESVRYGYARGACLRNCHLVFRLLSTIVDIGLGDGLVPAASQKPDYGDDLGQYDLDHISEVSREPDTAAERNRLIEQIRVFLNLPAKPSGS